MKSIGIIGAGNWGKILINEFIKISNIKVICTNGKQENLQWMEKNHPNIKSTTNVNSIFSDDYIDAVVIATPINTHFKLTKKALEANKHVFVEKPTATTTSEVEELFELARENNKILFTGYIYLYHDAYKYIKKNVNISQVKGLSFVWKKMGSFTESIFWNLLSHEIALCIDLLGCPEDAKLLKSEEVKTDADKIEVELIYNGTIVNILIDRMSEEKFKKMTINVKDKAYIWKNEVVYLHESGTTREIFKAEKNKVLGNEISKFLHMIDKKKSYFDEVAYDAVDTINKLQLQAKELKK